MKKIPVWFNNKIVDYLLVDNQDYQSVNQYTWYAQIKYPIAYTTRTTTIMAHNLIMGKPPKHYVWDHANGNGCDCTRKNLRQATFSQNAFNTPSNSRYGKGIGYYTGALNPWFGYIKLDGKRIYKGYFSSKEEAEYARDELVRKHVGAEFGRFHHPRSGERSMDGKIKR